MNVIRYSEFLVINQATETLRNIVVCSNYINRTYMKYTKQNYNKIVIIIYIVSKLLRNCVKIFIETILIKKSTY